MLEQTDNNLHTVEFRLWGVVQGVGMRPHIARTAAAWGVSGFVRNAGGMVRVRASAQQAALDGFVRDLIANKPAPAVFVRVEKTAVPAERFDAFTIEQSEEESGLVMIGADLPVCAACERELHDAKDPRYRHPFISCMACGPRYSIIDDVPYDRPRTAMGVYPLCARCEAQYRSPGDRRFHAQTIACHDCGPVLLYRSADGRQFEREDALSAAVDALRKNGLVAVKGTGGYHIACSPFSQEAVLAVRALKRREQKPFALLFANLESLEPYAQVSKAEAELLALSARPIVLLARKPSAIAEAVFSGSREIGAFLPSTPLQFLLSEACGPLLMTSANPSDQPILYDDAAMLDFCAKGLDGVLTHERGIRTGLDDSVLRVADGRTQMIRRSRGYVPLPVALPLGMDESVMLFAAGSDLKATFALTRGDFVYLSQPFGDAENEDAFAEWEKSRKRLGSLLSIAPQAAVCDLHPAYRTAQLARSLGLPLVEVQHHHAHTASVMAEHGIMSPVIGVAFDGTGYGTDGTIWGGEFLLCEKGGFTRLGHLRTIRMVGGDSAMREAWKSLICHLEAASLSAEAACEEASVVRAALRFGVNTHESSSMGRLFDAVCAFLGLSRENRYEGECGALLEKAAAEAYEKGDAGASLYFVIAEEGDQLIVDPSLLIKDLAAQKRAGASAGELALGFHRAVAAATCRACERIRDATGVRSAALSGGVFQNALLLRLTRVALEAAGFIVYQNEAVPPNDGGIALGQAYAALWQIKERT